MKKKNVSLRRYFGIFSGVKIPWVLYISAVVINLISYYFSLNMIYATGDIIDATGLVDNELLARYMIPMVLSTVFTTAIGILTGIANEKLNLGLRQKLWRKMMFLPNTAYDKDNGEGLVSRVTADCDSASGIFNVVLSSYMLVVSTVIYLRQMITTDITMSISSLALIPVSLLVGWIYGKMKYWVGSRTQGTLADATAYLVERTRNINLIRAAGTQETESGLGDKKFQAQYTVELKTGLVSAFASSMDRFYPVIGQAIVFILGGRMVAEGTMSVGDVVVFYTFASSISMYFTTLVVYFGRLKQSVGSLDRVVEVLEATSEDIDKGVQADMPDTDINVKDVVFGYGDKVVLDGVTCTIPKGKVTAVIGANGSGKSTLFKLLERFYAPEKGAILFGGRDVSDYSLRSWRRTIGYVPQDCAIMEGTLRENITYGSDLPVSDSELEKVARMANLTDLVASLPDGFDSYVAPGGRNFSGGQRQCIAIARAIMRNPDYLLLDEATSALDTRSRRMVTSALENLMKGRTTIMIAHDLASIRSADHIIVIKNGKVEACGSPAEIVKSSEQYRQLVMEQSSAATV